MDSQKKDTLKNDMTRQIFEAEHEAEVLLVNLFAKYFMCYIIINNVTYMISYFLGR